MDSYAIELEEVRAAARRLVADTAAIGDRADRLGAGEVTSDDFGGSGTATGAEYVAVTHQELPGSLRAFQQYGARLAEVLLSTYERYQLADDDAAQALRRAGDAR